MKQNTGTQTRFWPKGKVTVLYMHIHWLPMKQPCICYSMNSRDSARGISIQIGWLNGMEGNRTMGFSKQWKHNVNETFRPPWVVIWWHNSYAKCFLQNTILTKVSKYSLHRYCQKKGTSSSHATRMMHFISHAFRIIL
jgi:hypothetical protein